MSQKPKIFIGGDSWGCGEWSSDLVKQVTHKGLEQYLFDYGYTVLNASKGGSSNFESIGRLKKLLKYHSDNDIVFWIQTDALRDGVPYNKLTENILKEGGFTNFRNKLTIDAYRLLNELGVKINLIGGKEDLFIEALQDFANLIPLVPSWVYLLVGHFVEYRQLFPQYTDDANLSRYIEFDKYNIDFKVKIIDELYHSEKCWKMYKEDIFHPDGMHPNKNGHQILFEYIKKELNL